jgi:hypothetical protein
MWSSSFLQSCYYFDSLLRSPCKGVKRYRHRLREKRKFREEQVEKRHIKEQYRQTFGEEHTRQFGRPMGWVLLMAAIEKVFFPAALLIMIILRLWEPLGITVVAETVLSLSILTFVAKGHRAQYFVKGLLVTPMRYSSLLYDLVTIGRFSADIWIFRNRRWRK